VDVLRLGLDRSDDTERIGFEHRALRRLPLTSTVCGPLYAAADKRRG
jgi:hypothetical protein